MFNTNPRLLIYGLLMQVYERMKGYVLDIRLGDRKEDAQNRS